MLGSSTDGVFRRARVWELPHLQQGREGEARREGGSRSLAQGQEAGGCGGKRDLETQPAPPHTKRQSLSLPLSCLSDRRERKGRKGWVTGKRK